MQADISAEKMIMGVEGVDAARRERLIQLLDINLRWRLNRVSDGQRRRVQICMGLLKPYKVHQQSGMLTACLMGCLAWCLQNPGHFAVHHLPDC